MLEVGGEELQTMTLDHHGLIACVCEELKIAERIDAKLGPLDPRRVVSPGTAVVAMILNGLGFTNRRLYLTHQFFANKPVALLLGKPLQASDLTDYTLAHALDEISAYGASDLFGHVSFEIALEEDLLGMLNHLDTTSFSVEGQYERGSEVDTIQVTHGYSKDCRPDLKQVVLSLVVNGPSAIPLWMEPLDGNSSDQVSFHETITKVRAFQSQLRLEHDFKWVADSALYTKEKLLKSEQTYHWVTRVPERLQAAKVWIETPDEALDWESHAKGYRTTSMQTTYGGVAQRWILVSSEQAYQREKKTLEKRLKKQASQLDKDVWHLGNERFSCENDAQKAVNALAKRYSYFTLPYEVVAVKRYDKAGRPSAGDKKKVIGYQVTAHPMRNEARIEARLNSKGRFILATNDLNQQGYPDRKILTDYKQQQTVEGGFRFLKDPWFMLDSVFLKKPRRIEGLMMVMTLCLLVYNVAQYKLRKKLMDEAQTLPNQLGKEVQNPTMRWIFQLMEGINIVCFYHQQTHQLLRQVITNLNDLRKKIIRLFGYKACRLYGLIPNNAQEVLEM